MHTQQSRNIVSPHKAKRTLIEKFMISFETKRPVKLMRIGKANIILTHNNLSSTHFQYFLRRLKDRQQIDMYIGIILNKALELKDQEDSSVVLVRPILVTGDRDLKERESIVSGFILETKRTRIRPIEINSALQNTLVSPIMANG
jgi:hypothetical protein